MIKSKFKIFYEIEDFIDANNLSIFEMNELINEGFPVIYIGEKKYFSLDEAKQWLNKNFPKMKESYEKIFN